MGQAKRRGTLNERVQQAQERNAAAYEQARLQQIAEQQALEARLAAMTPDRRAMYERKERKRVRTAQILVAAAMRWMIR